MMLSCYQGAIRAVLGRNQVRTPRWVWLNSAIAAALVHSWLGWWGLAAWQQRRTTAPVPAPIKLVTLSSATASLAPATTTIADEIPTNQPEDASASTATPATSPPPTPAAPTPSNAAPTPPPSTTPQPQTPVSSAPSPTPLSSTTPTAPVSPATPTRRPSSPASPSSSNPASPTPPSRPSPAVPTPSPVAPTPPNGAAPNPGLPSSSPPSNAGGENSSSPPSPEISTGESQAGPQSWWSLQPAPGGGSDIHEDPPQMPLDWETETAGLLQRAACASGLVPPGRVISVTVWPAIDAQGQIMQFLPLATDTDVPPAVLQCLEVLRLQMPPLIPARDGGVALASDEVVLVIELQGTP